MQRNSTPSIGQYEAFVAQAIEGKYESFSDADIRSSVREAVVLCETAETSTELFANSRRIASPRDDVINQVVVLHAITRFSDDPALRAAPLAALHRLAYGAEIFETTRNTRVVEGFPGPVLTKLSETDARFSELQGLVIDLAKIPSPPVPVAAHLMAHVFAAVIRIHYFGDGNGRVARFAVQYLSATWGLGYFNVPKVRNDTLWKSALRNAIFGDIKDLATQISQRLAQKEI
jgi:fido (protein-threonine AMPylation protein)